MDHEQPLFLSNGDEAECSDLYEDNLPRRPLHQPVDIDFNKELARLFAPESDSEMEMETKRERKSSEAPPSSPRSEAMSLLGEDSEYAGLSSTANPGESRCDENTRSAKKRKQGDEDEDENPFPPRDSYYLGSIYVDNAWSTVRGTGYIKNGDQILVKRDPLPSNTSSGKKGKGKQMSLTSMFKSQSNSSQKKPKLNSIVRLTNMRGFEFGRLPIDLSNWISRLLDFEIISFKGSYMVDCPERLHTGVDLIISISFYILPTAFTPFKPKIPSPLNKPRPKVWFNEGAETTEEEFLRLRKKSLQQLFDKLELKPISGRAVDKHQEKENVPPDGSPRPSPSNGSQARKDPVNIEGSQGEADEDNDEETLDENAIDVIYKRAQCNDKEMDEMEPCDSFALKLRPYQKQALYWMYSRELGSEAARQSRSMHPLWSEYLFPAEPSFGSMVDLTIEKQPFYYNSHTGELSLDFPYSFNVCRGGILADEMGMGKTIMLSSLIQTNLGEKPEEQVPATSDQVIRNKQLRLDATFRPMTKASFSQRSRATLIVAPASLIDQWASEISRSSRKGTVNVFVWHGSGRGDLGSMIDCDIDAIDVVITSYGTLSSEHSTMERTNNPLFQIEWFRIVLDEAHNIKLRTNKAALAAFDLKSPRKWAVTGTPIVNRLEDLYSLLRFLKYEPWSDFAFFRSMITIPFLSRDPKAIEIVQVILESVLLRREKTMKDRDGNMIVVLPDKEVKYEYLEFSPLERAIYDDLYHKAKSSFESLDARGLVGKSYTHILAKLMKLRRAVLHPSLVSYDPDDDSPDPDFKDERINVKEVIKMIAENKEKSGEIGDSFEESVLAGLCTDAEEECPICMDVMNEPMLLPRCSHKCCKDCILAFLYNRAEKNEEGVCPTCRTGPVKEEDLFEILKRKKTVKTTVGIKPEGNDDEDEEDDPMAEMPSSSPAVELRRNDFQSSTKLNALIKHLRRLRDQDPCFRVIIFSQFTSFLDLIEVVMQRENLTWYRLDGTTEIRKRQKTIAEFSEPSRKPKVFLLSLKVGGVGLNLTSANHVFMMDCWWNAAIENQAVDRVHRIGQSRNVYVTHFIVSGTIETRILRIQKRKTAIIKEAFKDGSKDSDTIDNLRIMFGDEYEHDEENQ